MEAVPTYPGWTLPARRIVLLRAGYSCAAGLDLVGAPRLRRWIDNPSRTEHRGPRKQREDSNGPFTAVYVGGSSLSIVGASNFAPHTAAMKAMFLFNSVVGTSVISLTLTYLMQIYAALRERNALGLKMHASSGETGDAAELLAGLFPDGELSGGYNNL